MLVDVFDHLEQRNSLETLIGKTQVTEVADLEPQVRVYEPRSRELHRPHVRVDTDHASL